MAGKDCVIDRKADEQRWKAGMIELRRVDPSFAPDLAELWSTTFEEAYKDEHSAENIRAYCAANYTVDAAEAVLSDPRVFCRVAFRDRTALGFHLVKHHDCPAPLAGGSSELKQLYIRAGEYGSGVGRRLMDDAMGCVRNAGRSWIWLSVSDRNHRARSFYRKLAFKPLGKGPVFEVGTERLTSTIMAREV